jgi:hypothetical protein
MQIIPLQAVPSQTLSTTLNGQAVQLSIYSMETPGSILSSYGSDTADSTIITADNTNLTADVTTENAATTLQGYDALYIDVILAGQQIVTARLVRNLIPIMLTSSYYGFEGELAFVDTQNVGLQSGTQPVYTGLGTQYQLVYYSPADLAAA